jgi:hypothetical protein
VTGSNEAVSRREFEQLRSDHEDLEAQLARFKGALTTPDMYIRYERIPQFVGGVTHLAGSEEILSGDRWEYIAPEFPIPGVGANLIIAKTVNTATVLDVTEEGKLLSVGLLAAFAEGAYTTTPNIVLDLVVTIDGGTEQRLPVCPSTAAFTPDLLPWHTYSGGRDTVVTGPAFGGKTGDALSLDLNFEYKTSLKIELDCTTSSNWTGAETYMVSCYVHRARLVSV